MKIALDFDGTYTADPDFWHEFINEALVNGHHVWIVTARDEENDGINWSKVGLKHAPCPVVFCDGCPKRQITRELGIEIDVWIDDNPYGIVAKGASFSTPDALGDWRMTDKYRGSKLPITGESRGFDTEANRDRRPAEDTGVSRPRLQQRSDKRPG